jgi:hypothetical protein
LRALATLLGASFGQLGTSFLGGESGRSHSETWAGCIVSVAILASSAFSESRSRPPRMTSGQCKDSPERRVKNPAAAPVMRIKARFHLHIYPALIGVRPIFEIYLSDLAV